MHALYVFEFIDRVTRLPDGRGLAVYHINKEKLEKRYERISNLTVLFHLFDNAETETVKVRNILEIWPTGTENVADKARAWDEKTGLPLCMMSGDH